MLLNKEEEQENYNLFSFKKYFIFIVIEFEINFYNSIKINFEDYI